MKIFALVTGYALADCGENEAALDGVCYKLGKYSVYCYKILNNEIKEEPELLALPIVGFGTL